MVAIFTLLLTITISVLVTRVGAIALGLTGLSREVARFQARSAFTGVGYTTGESEKIVNHPVRRRILMLLMFWGNIGIAAVIAGTIASFAMWAPEPGQKIDEKIYAWISRIGVLGLGIATLWGLFTSRYIDGLISRSVEHALLKWTKLDVRDYVSLLHLQHGYVVVELQVKQDDWIDGKDLAEANLSSEGVLVLGLTRSSGNYIGSPNGKTKVQHDDVLTIYGTRDRLDDLDIRKRGYQGDRAHRNAIAAQQQADKETETTDST